MRPTIALALGADCVFALSLLSVLTRPAGSEVAMWWPASAAAVWMVMTARAGTRWRPVLAVVAAVAAGNASSGRGLVVSGVFGACNGADALVAGVLLRPPENAPAALRSVRDLGRLLGAATAGAVTIALTAGPAAWWLLGADPLRTGLAVLASHGSAMLLLLPLGLATRRIGGEAGARERAAQVLLLVLIVAFTFGPWQQVSLSLLPGAALVWSAMRFGMFTCSSRTR